MHFCCSFFFFFTTESISASVMGSLVVVIALGCLLVFVVGQKKVVHDQNANFGNSSVNSFHLLAELLHVL